MQHPGRWNLEREMVIPENKRVILDNLGGPFWEIIELARATPQEVKSGALRGYFGKLRDYSRKSKGCRRKSPRFVLGNHRTRTRSPPDSCKRFLAPAASAAPQENNLFSFTSDLSRAARWRKRIPAALRACFAGVSRTF